MTSNLKGAVVVNAYWRGGDDGAKNIARALSALGASVDFLRASEIDLGVGEGVGDGRGAERVGVRQAMALRLGERLGRPAGKREGRAGL